MASRLLILGTLIVGVASNAVGFHKALFELQRFSECPKEIECPIALDGGTIAIIATNSANEQVTFCLDRMNIETILPSSYLTNEKVMEISNRYVELY